MVTLDTQQAAREVGKRWAVSWLQQHGYDEAVRVELAADFMVGKMLRHLHSSW